jgi:hypothetical protein
MNWWFVPLHAAGLGVADLSIMHVMPRRVGGMPPAKSESAERSKLRSGRALGIQKLPKKLRLLFSELDYIW